MAAYQKRTKARMYFVFWPLQTIQQGLEDMEAGVRIGGQKINN
jgi:hypothetical protein